VWGTERVINFVPSVVSSWASDSFLVSLFMESFTYYDRCERANGLDKSYPYFVSSVWKLARCSTPFPYPNPFLPGRRHRGLRARLQDCFSGRYRRVELFQLLGTAAMSNPECGTPLRTPQPRPEIRARCGGSRLAGCDLGGPSDRIWSVLPSGPRKDRQGFQNVNRF